MTPRQLKAFVTVAQTLNFARACEQLHLSQPALSLAIRSLEQDLGGRLFSRSTRQVRLTPEGAALLPQAIILLGDWDGLRERAQQRFALDTGHLTIAAMPSFAANVLPHLLRSFRQRHPGVVLSVRDIIHEQVLEAVESGRVEVGFTFEPEASPALVFDELFRDSFVAIVPRDSPLGNAKRLTWHQLLGFAFIALERPSSMRRLIEARLAAAGVDLKVAMECNQLTTVCQLVAAGLGVSVIPAFGQRQATSAGARCVPISRPAVRLAVGIVRRKDQQLSTAAQALFEIARTWVTKPREIAHEE